MVLLVCTNLQHLASLLSLLLLSPSRAGAYLLFALLDTWPDTYSTVFSVLSLMLPVSLQTAGLKTKQNKPGVTVHTFSTQETEAG